MKLSIYKVEKIQQKGFGEKIVLFGNTKNNERYVLTCFGHSPYFYVNEKASIPYSDLIIDQETGHKSYSDENLVKLITKNSNDVTSVRKLFNEVDCYEDDILYVDRWAIDVGLKNGIEVPLEKDIHYTKIKPIDFYVQPKRLHIDIEVLTEFNRLPQYETANKRITSLSCIDNYSKVVTTFVNTTVEDRSAVKWSKRRINSSSVLYSAKEKETVVVETLETQVGTKYKWRKIYYKSDILVEYTDKSLTKKKSIQYVEITMLNRFLDYFEKIECGFFAGWNISGFDLPYLVHRMKKLGVDYRRFSPIRSVMINTSQFYLDIITVKGIVVFDTMQRYIGLHTHKISGKLNDAANVKLGYGKVSFTGSLDNLYETNLELFLKYNAIDVVMEYEIFEKMKMMDYYGRLKNFIGVPYQDMSFNSRVIDFYFLTKAKEKRIVLPSARYNKKMSQQLSDDKFSGAYVPIPTKTGRTKYVLTIDLKSLYPMIMLTWNLGNDTLIDDDKLTELRKDDIIKTPIVRGKGRAFSRHKLSFISECLKELIEYRDELKQQLYEMKKFKKEKGYADIEIEILDSTQTVVKFLTNTIYGVLGRKNYRLFNLVIAECVTTIGRMILTESIDYINDYKPLLFILKVLGGDTDSAFVNLIDDLTNIDKVDKKVIQSYLNIFNDRCDFDNKDKFNDYEKVLIGLSYDITDKLNIYYEKYISKYNLNKSYLSIKPEDISSVFFNVEIKSGTRAAKKRYAKKKIVEFIQDKPIKMDEIDIKGFIRSDLSIVGNQCMETVMNLICVDKGNVEIRNDVVNYLRSEISKVLNMKYPFTDICKRVGMNQHIHVYRNEEHVRAARWTNEYAHLWKGISNYDAGSIVKYLFVEPSRMFREYARTNVIALDDNNHLPKKFIEILDFKEIINTTILEPLAKVLESLQIDFNYIKTGKEEKAMF